MSCIKLSNISFLKSYLKNISKLYMYILHIHKIFKKNSSCLNKKILKFYYILIFS